MAVQVVQELAREQMPRRRRENLVGELAQGVVRHAEIIQKRRAGIRFGKLVIVGLGEHAVEHVLKNVLTVQVVVLDVLALASLKSLVERNHQQAAVHGFGLVAELRQLVDALNHEPAKQYVAGCLVLAIQLEGVARDDALERRRVVHERARVVLVGDDGGHAGQRLQHERLREVLQGNGCPSARPA